MEFGLFYEICVPKPWDHGKEAQTFHDIVEQVRYAEEMGFRYVWLTEHHFLTEFAHSSAPEVLLGAFSQVTTKMRLGHGIALTPPAYNHPVRVAERAATIDILSNGRLELGTGRSATPTELGGFEIDGNESRDMWLEGTEAVVKLLTEENVTLDGTYVQMPERTVVPRCVQQPHPPLWMAGTSPSTTERAAANGVGVLFFAHGVRPEDLQPSVESYRANVTKSTPIGKMVNNALAGFCNGLCGEDDAETRRIGGQQAFDYLTRGIAHSRWPEGVEPPKGYEYTKGFYGALDHLQSIGPEGMIDQNMLMAGNPDSCNQLVKQYADLGVDQLIIHMQAWGTPHDKVMESIRTFGTHVIPEYSKG